MACPKGAGMAEISAKSHFLDFWGQMHIFVKFHVSNYFLQKVTPKTKKKVGKWVFHENVEKSQKIEKIDFSLKYS